MLSWRRLAQQVEKEVAADGAERWVLVLAAVVARVAIERKTSSFAGARARRAASKTPGASRSPPSIRGRRLALRGAPGRGARSEQSRCVSICLSMPEPMRRRPSAAALALAVARVWRVALISAGLLTFLSDLPHLLQHEALPRRRRRAGCAIARGAVTTARRLAAATKPAKLTATSSVARRAAPAATAGAAASVLSAIATASTSARSSMRAPSPG